MEIVTLEELIDSIQETVQTDIEDKGIEAWSIDTIGVNLVDELEHYSDKDLEDLLEEISEGAKIEIKIDLSSPLSNAIEEILTRRQADDDEEDDEDEEEELDEDN